MNNETIVKYLRDAIPLGEHPTPHAEFITVRLDTVQAAADAIERLSQAAEPDLARMFDEAYEDQCRNACGL